MSEDLKPVRCGCGGTAVVKMWAEPDTPYLVMCEKCKTASGDYSTEAEAITAWNRAMSGQKGHWKTVEDYNGDEHYKCSECGGEFILIDGTPEDNEYYHCPRCGADMRGDK